MMHARLAMAFPLLTLMWAVLLCLTSAVANANEMQIDNPPTYVGSDRCTDCHTDAAEAWSGSHHAKAWTPPLSEHVLGDFDNASLTHKDVTSRFYREGEDFMIETDGPDGSMTRYPVAGVIGVEPLQQYVVETEPGKLQSVDVVWDTELQRWYHLYPDQDLPAGDGLHWTGPYKNWNARCADCHATGFEKNYNPQDKSYASTQAEIGVGCEACHGPAEAHLRWAETGTSLAEPPWSGINAMGFVLDLSQGGDILMDQCAGCHSRREPFEAGNPFPGTPFHDAHRLSTLRDGLYHADGQILDEVYVYGSFLQSKMYAKGVTCMNCHDPHSAERIAEGNALCTQCHSLAGNVDFPSLPLAEYDDPSHHFHPEDSAGAQCKSCHMIERDYMVVDGRRDHSFRIPRPDLSVETRSPNACTDCHDDKTARWAAEAVAGWYPDSTRRGPHYGQVIAAARNGLAAQTEGLVGIAEYTELPGIVRATALEMLAQVSTPEIATRLEPLLADPDALVRANAIQVQRGAPETERSARLVGMLGDPVKSVRMAAAREFLGMRIAHMPDRMSQDLNTAMGEWQQSLMAKSDFPETQMVMAGIGLTTRRMDAALNAFGEAVEMDPQLTQAWTMIVRIHNALGDNAAARNAVDQAIAANPDDIPLKLLKADLPE